MWGPLLLENKGEGGHPHKEFRATLVAPSFVMWVFLHVLFRFLVWADRVTPVRFGSVTVPACDCSSGPRFNFLVLIVACLS